MAFFAAEAFAFPVAEEDALYPLAMLLELATALEEPLAAFVKLEPLAIFLTPKEPCKVLDPLRFLDPLANFLAFADALAAFVDPRELLLLLETLALLALLADPKKLLLMAFLAAALEADTLADPKELFLLLMAFVAALEADTLADPKDPWLLLMAFVAALEADTLADPKEPLLLLMAFVAALEASAVPEAELKELLLDAPLAWKAEETLEDPPEAVLVATIASEAFAEVEELNAGAELLEVPPEAEAVLMDPPDCPDDAVVMVEEVEDKEPEVEAALPPIELAVTLLVPEDKELPELDFFKEFAEASLEEFGPKFEFWLDILELYLLWGVVGLEDG